MPRLQQLVAEEFPSCEVLSSISSDEVVAIGGAIEGSGLLQKGDKVNREGKQCIPCSSQDLWLAVSFSMVVICVCGGGACMWGGGVLICCSICSNSCSARMRIRAVVMVLFCCYPSTHHCHVLGML